MAVLSRFLGLVIVVSPLLASVTSLFKIPERMKGCCRRLLARTLLVLVFLSQLDAQLDNSFPTPPPSTFSPTDTWEPTTTWFPTATPLPTSSCRPTHLECNICDSIGAGFVVGDSDATLELPTAVISCGAVERAGKEGRLDARNCHFLQAAVQVVGEQCACKNYSPPTTIDSLVQHKESNTGVSAPIEKGDDAVLVPLSFTSLTPTVEPFPVCHICGASNQEFMHSNGKVLAPDTQNVLIDCKTVMAGGLRQLWSPEQCAYFQSAARESCGCLDFFNTDKGKENGNLVDSSMISSHGFTSCSICGMEGLRTTKPNATIPLSSHGVDLVSAVLVTDKPNLTCAILQEQSSVSLLSPVVCAFFTMSAAEVCDCQPDLLADPPTKVPLQHPTQLLSDIPSVDSMQFDSSTVSKNRSRQDFTSSDVQKTVFMPTFFFVFVAIVSALA